MSMLKAVAVCIENFKGRDVIRILPCKYVPYSWDVKKSQVSGF